MLELAFVAYVLSLLSIVCNIWLLNEVRELKQQRKRDAVTRRLNTVVKTVEKPRPKSYWG